MSQPETNYARLERLLDQPLVDLHPGDYFWLKPNGFMDLIVEVLSSDDEDSHTISLAHFFMQNGELCQEPEMTVRATHAEPKGFPHGALEALTFRQTTPPIYQEVEPTEESYLPELHEQLNTYLWRWLQNLENQGLRLDD